MVDVDRMYESKMIRLKYARAYFSALSKIQVKDTISYSEEDCKLTPEESKALMYYINNRDDLAFKSRRSR